MASSDESRTASADLIDNEGEKGIFQIICYMLCTGGCVSLFKFKQ